jgi:hypothetical protein
MPRYLTPLRYRALGTGVDLSSKTDAELAAHLDAASALVNAWCAAPDGHDFRGGTITGEKHRWEIGNVYKSGTQRIWPFHKPVKSVSALEIQVTNTQQITFSGGNLYLNEYDGYVEPIALGVTTAGMFGWAILPNVGMATPVGVVDYAYGWEFQATDEELFPYSGQLMAGNQFWDQSQTVTIKKNGLVQTSGFTIDYEEGTVTVSGGALPSDTWTATYSYPLPPGIARATGFVMDDLHGQSAIAAAGMIGLSGIKVEEVELRQSSRVNFAVQPINAAAATLLAPYRYVSIA